MPWIVFYQGIPLLRRTCKTPCCTKTNFKGSRLGPRSYWLKTYFVALFFTISKLSLHFLQVLWLGSEIKFTERTIWSLHPVYCTMHHLHWWLFISDKTIMEVRVKNRYLTLFNQITRRIYIIIYLMQKEKKLCLWVCTCYYFLFFSTPSRK